MQQDDLEVQFCDLCGTSVPLADLESGTATRHQAKTIGACCLGVLRQGDSPLAQPGKSGSDAVGVGEHAGAGTSGAGKREGMLLPVAIALLAGMAGVIIYLDLKIQSVADEQMKEQKAVAGGLSTSRKVLTEMEQAMDGVARKSDTESLLERLQSLDNIVQLHQEQARQQSEKFRKVLDGVKVDVTKLEASRIDYRPLFDDLRQQIQRQSVAIGDLRTVATTPPPVDAVAPRGPEVELPPADPGLPDELAAQVKRLGDGDAAVRFEAVDHLLVSQNLAVLPHLVPMTLDSDGFVRRLTVEGLRDFKHKDSVEALLDALADADPTVAETAWSSLKRLTGQKIAFDANSPSKDARMRAQQRWRDWWEKSKATFGS